MLRPQSGTVFEVSAIGYLVGKLDMLRVECPTCGRQGQYSVARLVAVFGPHARLTDWLSMLTADCPQTNQKGVTRARGAVMPDLRKLLKRATDHF